MDYPIVQFLYLSVSLILVVINFLGIVVHFFTLTFAEAITI